jgi:hypothetical protein
MFPKIAMFITGLLISGWMIFDGIHVLRTGKYFGPPEPGPWSKLVSLLGINPFSMGIPFIILGILWLVGLVGIAQTTSWGWTFALAVSIATLWYLPIGTVLSLLYIILLIVFKTKLGY